MKKMLQRVISILLTLVMILQVFPATIFATEDESTISDDIVFDNAQSLTAVEDLAAGDDLQNAEVLFEETSLREENVKHFRLNDGTYMAVQYDTPVHYRDHHGNWADFDNTLRPVNTLDGSGVSSYRVTNGDSVRVFASDANAEVLLAVQKGDYGLSLTPVREAEAELTVESGQSALAASYELTAEDSETASAPAAILETASAGEAAADDGLLSSVQPDKIYSALEYPASFQGATLRYENYANTVKESLVISAPQAEYTYSFQMETDGLTPALQADGSILLSTEDGNVIYSIPAPYMIDDNGEYSYAAAYTLTGSGSTWILTVTADAQWMNDDSRAFPVLLDPSITEPTNEDADMSAAYVRAGKANTPDTNRNGLYVGTVDVTTANPNGMTRSYFHVNDLIDLPSGCEVITAQLSLYQFAFGKKTNGTSSLDIGLHGLSIADGLTVDTQTASDWYDWATGLTWNQVHNSSHTMHREDVVDIQTVTALPSGTSEVCVTWDITSLAYEWYSDPGKNLGFALIAEDEDNVTARASFHSPNGTGTRPTITIVYRNTVGIEPYYTYQTAGIGRAGTSYISDYAMQNTLVVPLISSSSNVMPSSLSLVYNSAYGAQQFTSASEGIHTKSFSNMILGAGWKLSAQETVVSQTVGNTTYRIYTDADGTEHFFQYNSASGKYEDEDGLGLTITGSGSYTMTDLYGNTWYFGSGFLKWKTDAYGNKITYTYNTSNQLTGITRKNTVSSTTETLASLEYSGGKLTKVTDEADRATNLTYTTVQGVTCLTQIAFQDGAKAKYTYYDTADASEKARMKTAYDAEANYGIEYSYSYNKDVKNFYEYVMDGATRRYGEKIHGFKRSHSQAAYRYYGKDGIDDRFGGSGDDILTFKIFDRFGKTINSYSTDATEQHVLGVGAAAYTANSGTSRQNNRLTANTAAGLQGVNLLKNSSAENGTTDWTGGSVSTSYAYSGTSSFTVNSSLLQAVELDQGKTYTFSAYVRTTNSAVKLVFRNSSGTDLKSSETVNYSTAGAGGGWQRLTVTYEAPSDGDYYIAVVKTSATGTVYADCMQLEQEESASTYNLLENGSFEEAETLGTSDNGRWYRLGTAGISESTATYFGTKSLYLEGTAGKHHVMQRVVLNCEAGSTFLVSAWAKAGADPESVAQKTSDSDVYFGVYVRIYYENVSTPETQFFPFDPYYTGWQYCQGIVAPSQSNADKRITAVLVALAYDNNFNGAYFDNVSLRLEPAQTYRYDSNGNLLAATQSGAGQSSATYSGVDLTACTAANGNCYSYTYNSQHDIKTAAAAGITNTYTYDTSGNVLASKLTGTGTTSYLQSTATATGDGNHTATVTDVNGNTTTYHYNSQYEYLTSVVNAKNQTTYYIYDTDNSRPTMTYQSGIASVSYSYSSDGRLSELDRKTFRSGTELHQYYNFAYNRWGQQTGIQVGSQNLATYTYEDISEDSSAQGKGGGNLKKLTYGNGQYVEYTYDEFDRLVKMVYNSGRYVTYTYNAEGSLAKLTYGDGTTEKGSYTFEYDSLGRPVRSTEYRAGSLLQRTEHLYDAYNRLYIQRWVMGGKSRSEKYTYSDGANGDGSLTQLKTGSGYKINYTYDGLKRLQTATVANSSDVELFKTAYAFRSVSGNQSSAQVQYRNVRTIEGDLILGYKYSYDALGNITQISQSEGSYYPLVKYTYDNQNQLTKETYYDGAGNTTDNITKTITYTYDTAGNILSETKTVGTTTTTKNYTYSEGNWKDLLTQVGNITISYDGGNPTNWYNGSKTYTGLTWTNGRQLTSVTVGSKTATYAYDADGIRTQKTVDGVTHTYYTLNGKLMRESFPYSDTTIIMDFIYDESGKPFAVCYSKDGGAKFTPYFYATNLQGDVEGIFRVLKNGTTGLYEQKWYGRYTYDAWGNVTAYTAAGNSPGSTTLVYRNPIRFRGYVYDNETGWYYLQSRYYDPANHRFINADSYASTDSTDAIACNMFAYCGNNPVNRIDPRGLFWEEIGSFFKTVGNAIADFAEAAFGAEATVVHQSKQETEFSPAGINLIVTVKTGTKESIYETISGNSSKPISVYAQGRSDDYLLSSAGIKINIGSFTLNISLGLDNIGLSGSVRKGNVTRTFGIRADLSQLKVGLEVSSTVKRSENTSITTYTNASVTGLLLAEAYIYATTGQLYLSPEQS